MVSTSDSFTPSAQLGAPQIVGPVCESGDFLAKGNKFVHIDDYEVAQRILDSQLDTRWNRALDGFIPAVFPAMKEILGPHLSYYWTLWQSEWATDIMFDSPAALAEVYPGLIRNEKPASRTVRFNQFFDRRF